MDKDRKMILKLTISGIILCIILFFIYNKVSHVRENIYGKVKRIVIQDVLKINVENESEKWAESVPVLMYHHLLKDEENPFKDNCVILPVKTFKKHMDLLYENGYYTVGLDELESFVKGELKLPKRSVLITFDDGYKSNYEYAYPILKEYGFRAAIFLISGWNTDEIVSFDADELQHLSWNEIENSRDVFEYASHTHDLHKLDENEQGYLVTRPPDEVRQDLKTSMQLLDTVYFAYPYGHYNEETLEILKELGYRMAFTIEPGRVKPGDSLLELNRYTIFSYTSLRDFKKMVDLR